ncbi:MAG: DinB family protein, partial [Vicinamibacterales bacterium]
MHLHSILRGAHAYLSPLDSFVGLSLNQADERSSHSGHSIAEIVAHMAFWQDWFLDRCDGIATPIPVPAALGWPTVPEGAWDAVLARFESGFKRALALSDDDVRSVKRVSPAIEFEHLANYTAADALIHVALHNAHHTGQVIT